METAPNPVNRMHRALVPEALAVLEEFRSLSDVAAVLVARSAAIRHDWHEPDDLAILGLLDDWVERASHLAGPPSGAYDAPVVTTIVACPLPGYFVG